jgi:Flp pilus assembly protein TadD
LLLAALAACSRPSQPRAERIAILPFENLTGDASLDWVRAAAPAIVNAEMTAAGKITAIRADNVNSAYAENATRFLHGYFTGRAGNLRFEIESEDASRHKMVANVAETGSVLGAMNAIAKRFDPSAHPFSTSNEEALAAWGRGDFEHAVAIDPNFGAAWLSWTDSLAAHGDTAAALDVAHRALAEPSLRSDVDRAKIEAASAALSGDTAGRAHALEKLASLTPNDIALLNTLAETEMLARDFPAAVSPYRKILAMDPANGAAMNSLGYAQAEAGDLEGARRSFEDYGAQPGQKTNSLDSLGEAYFMNGRFADAEKSFLEAYREDPAFLSGTDLSKAGYAHWLGGDLKGADAIMKRYFDSRRNDRLIAWREAAWLYTTGRREPAVAALNASPDKQVAARQLAIWNAKITDDAAALKKKFDATPPTSDGEVRTFYAAALLASGDRDHARTLLQLWPLPDVQGGDPFVESLVFPKFIELRKAAGLK